MSFFTCLIAVQEVLVMIDVLKAPTLQLKVLNTVHCT